MVSEKDMFRRNGNSSLPEDYVPPTRDEYALWHPLMRDERNFMKTTALFFETRRESDVVPIFTLKDRDHVVDGVVYPSLRKIYLSYDHAPGAEYEFAMDVFGSWEHWVKLTQSSVRNEIQAWRDELEIKLKAESIRQMIIAARSDDAKGVSAAKWLADKGYAPKRIAGRPSAAEVERERKQQAGVNRDLAEDMERLGLQVVSKGG